MKKLLLFCSATLLLTGCFTTVSVGVGKEFGGGAQARSTSKKSDCGCAKECPCPADSVENCGCKKAEKAP